MDGTRMAPPGAEAMARQVKKVGGDLKALWDRQRPAIDGADTAHGLTTAQDPLFDAFWVTYQPARAALSKAAQQQPENYVALGDKGSRCVEAYLTMDNAAARAFQIVGE
jgi:hypothetical protein